MVFTTFYFSGTGNTRWAVEQFNRIVVGKGDRGEILSIDIMEGLTDDKIKECLTMSDFIGFANPIYGADIPPVMRKFLSRIDKIQERMEKRTIPVYIINTYAYINAFGPFAMKKIFADTSFYIKGYVNIQLCNNISKPKLKSEKISKEELDRRKTVARQQLLELYERLISDRKYIMGRGPYLIPGIFIRKLFKRAVAENYKTFSVNNQTCIKCMKCVDNCPTGSINYSSENFLFSYGCTACMRCYNFCPTASIMIDGIYADPEIYYRYRGPCA